MKSLLLILLVTTQTFAQTSWIVDAAKTSERVIVDAGSSYKTIIPFDPLTTDPKMVLANHRLPNYDSSFPIVKARRAVSGDEVYIYNVQTGTSNYSINTTDGYTEDGSTQSHYIVNWYDQTATIGVTLVGDVLRNGDMEATGFWGNWNLPIINERSSEQAHTGTYSRKVSGNSGTGTRNFGITTVTDRYYIVTFWAYSTDGVNIQVGFGSGGGGGIFVPLIVTPPIGSWKQYTAIAREPIGGANAFVGFAPSGAASTFYVDDVYFKEFLGNHAYQTTAANQPELIFNNINGHPAVNFDGSTDYLIAAHSTDFDAGAGGFAYYSKYDTDSTTTLQVLAAMYTTTSVQVIYDINAATPIGRIFFYTSPVVYKYWTSTLPSYDWLQYLAQRKADILEIYYNGTFSSSGITPIPGGTMQVTSVPLWIGARNHTGFEYFFDGRMSNFLVYKKTLVTNDINAVSSYFNNY